MSEHYATAMVQQNDWIAIGCRCGQIIEGQDWGAWDEHRRNAKRITP